MVMSTESITSAVKKIMKLDYSQLQKNCFDFLLNIIGIMSQKKSRNITIIS